MVEANQLTHETTHSGVYIKASNHCCMQVYRLDSAKPTATMAPTATAAVPPITAIPISPSETFEGQY